MVAIAVRSADIDAYDGEMRSERLAAIRHRAEDLGLTYTAPEHSCDHDVDLEVRAQQSNATSSAFRGNQGMPFWRGRW